MIVRCIRAAGTALMIASALQAQRAATQCPVVNGIVASVTSGDSTSSRISRDTGAARRTVRATSIDTTWTFDIRERTWTWSSLAASVGVGLGGTSGEVAFAGMTPARDSLASRAWSVCAAASVGMQNSTLTLRGARGTVHLRANVTTLEDAGRRMRDTTSRPRR